MEHKQVERISKTNFKAWETFSDVESYFYGLSLWLNQPIDFVDCEPIQVQMLIHQNNGVLLLILQSFELRARYIGPVLIFSVNPRNDGAVLAESVVLINLLPRLPANPAYRGLVFGSAGDDVVFEDYFDELVLENVRCIRLLVLSNLSASLVPKSYLVALLSLVHLHEHFGHVPRILHELILLLIDYQDTVFGLTRKLV